jgi:hypothetical protein
MPSGDNGCNREALRYWLAARGTTAHQVESALHFGDDLITKFLRGRTKQLGINKVQPLAAYLNVPTFALLTPGNPADEKLRAWASVLEPQDDRSTMAEYSSLCAQAEDHWTIHRSLNAYLLHPDHFQAKEVEVLKALLDFKRGKETYEAYLERAEAFYRLMRRAHLPTLEEADQPQRPPLAAGQADAPPRRSHLSSRSFHRVVTQASLFDDVSNPEWMAIATDNLKLFGLHPYGQLLLSLLPPVQFNRLDRTVTGILKAIRIPNPEQWYAINIVDGRYFLIQTGGMTFPCYHEKAVRDLLQRLTAAVGQIDSELGEYFSDEPPKMEVKHRVNTRSRRLMEARLRQSERSRPNN